MFATPYKLIIHSGNNKVFKKRGLWKTLPIVQVPFHISLQALEELTKKIVKRDFQVNPDSLKISFNLENNCIVAKSKDIIKSKTKLYTLTRILK